MDAFIAREIEDDHAPADDRGSSANDVSKHRVPECPGKFSYGGKVRKSSKVIMVCQKCGAIEYV
jgi:hypothetical protein